MQPLRCRRTRRWCTATKARLNKTRSLTHFDTKGARRNLDIERAVVAFGNAVEFDRVVGDQAGEDVEPSGRAFWVGGAKQAAAQLDRFQQGHDVHATAFENGVFGQINLVGAKVVDLALYRTAFARQETCADAVGNGTEAQIKAGGLNLFG